MRLGNGIHQPIPNACLEPAIDAVIGGCIRPITLRQIAPELPFSIPRV
jgi:hypothetical protein